MGRRGKRYGTRFGSWIIGYGVTKLTRELAARRQPVTRQALYRWCWGTRVPRPAVAHEMVRIAAGSLTLDDIYSHRDQMNAPKEAA